MKGDLTWCKFRFSWIKVFKTLSNTEKDRLLDAIEAYTNDKEMPELLGKESVAWALIETELEYDKESRRKAADSHREAGKNGGRPKTNNNQTEPNETKRNQIGYSETKNNQNGLRVKELRVKENIEVNNIAETSVSAPKPKLSPDEHEFWKFAKENAELAETFYRATGIYPVKSQFGRWVNDLKDLAEADISPERLRKTIEYMYSEHIPVSAPGSCLKTAQYLKSRGSVPVRKNSAVSTSVQDRWDIAAQELKAELSHPDSVYALFGTTDEGEVVDL